MRCIRSRSVSSAETVTKLHDLWQGCIGSPFGTVELHKRAVTETEWKAANLCLLMFTIKSRQLQHIMGVFLIFFFFFFALGAEFEFPFRSWMVQHTALSTVKVSQSHQAHLHTICNTNDPKGWKFSRNTVVSWGSYSSSGAKESGVEGRSSITQDWPGRKPSESFAVLKSFFTQLWDFSPLSQLLSWKQKSAILKYINLGLLDLQ